MKLKKKFNNIIILGVILILLIFIIFYFLNKTYNKENFKAPKGKGVSVRVVNTKLVPATGGKMAKSNDVASCLNNTYENPTSTDAALRARAVEIKQSSVANTSGKVMKATPRLMLQLASYQILNMDNPDNFKKYISDLDITNLIIINKNLDLINSLPVWKKDIIFQRLTSSLSSDAIINLRQSDYDLLEKYMTEAQKKKIKSSLGI
jgi:hypothetical protein